MTNYITLNPTSEGICHCIKADNFNWKHITAPRGGYILTGLLIEYD